MMARAGGDHRRAMSFRFLLACSLGLSAACFGDPPATGSESETTGGGPGSGDDGGNTQGPDSSGSNDTSGPSNTTVASASGDDDTASSGGTAAPGDTSSSDGGGSSEGGSSSDAGTTAACEPITEDASAIGQKCVGNGDCPAGYTCQTINGIQAQHLCQILCEETCECPDGLSCVEVEDKLMIPWHQCAP